MKVKSSKKVSKNQHKLSKDIVKKIDLPVEIMGVAITGTRKMEVLSKIWLQRKEMLHVATVNPEYVMAARSNENFKNILNRCLTVADGHGIVWSVRLLSVAQDNSIDRISGDQLVGEILKHANEKNEKVFLLGAANGVAQRAADEIQKKYPNVRLSWYEGAKTVAVEQKEEASMTIAKINGFEPDYLFVAYGSPWQDLWIEENRPYLRVRVAMGVGGVLDEWAGTVKLCPMWLDQIGMKWAWRVIHEPWRWKRVVKVLQFGLLVWWERFKKIL